MKYPTNPQQVLFKFVTLILALQTQALNQTYSSQAPNSVHDPYKLLHIIPNPNGTLTRIKQYFPTVPPNTSSTLSFSRDVPLNRRKGTWVRMYLSNTPEPVSFPIMVYAHGGGFIILSTATPNFDSFLSNTARELRVLVVSVEYRLAPEHRLPAAYDDVLEALYWVKKKKDEWVSKYGDVSKCILMGESAGGNIAYNVGLRASVLVRELKPLVIKGLVLIQPFFGAVKRTKSELRPPIWVGLPILITDLMWNLSLPYGANRNHPYCNPIIGGGSSKLEKMKELGWEVAIAGCDGDRLYNKQVEVLEFLRKRGVNAVGNFSKGDYHGVFVEEAAKAQMLFEFVRNVFSSYLTR